MKYRDLANTVYGSLVPVGAAIVKQALPTGLLRHIDPFLLLHHAGPMEVEPGMDLLDLAPHPHRGFEPVTFLFEGGLAHRDSRGNEGILSSGDVQWMTAGMGIVHSERMSRPFLQEGGTFELIQLWVNLPSKDKMTQPRYQDLKSDQIPRIREGGTEIGLVAGEFGGKKGPALTHTPIIALMVEMEAGSVADFPLPHTFNAFAYLLQGEVAYNDLEEGIPGGSLTWFNLNGDGFRIRANQKSRLLIMAGEPIREPIVQHGPFVMNTQTEILEAMRDYRIGKMGMLTY
jgi:redox-sensitive bicupin YhaK (pirin superfamily)